MYVGDGDARIDGRLDETKDSVMTQAVQVVLFPLQHAIRNVLRVQDSRLPPELGTKDFKALVKLVPLFYTLLLGIYQWREDHKNISYRPPRGP